MQWQSGGCKLYFRQIRDLQTSRINGLREGAHPAHGPARAAAGASCRPGLSRMCTATQKTPKNPPGKDDRRNVGNSTSHHLATALTQEAYRNMQPDYFAYDARTLSRIRTLRDQIHRDEYPLDAIQVATKFVALERILCAAAGLRHRTDG